MRAACGILQGELKRKQVAPTPTASSGVIVHGGVVRACGTVWCWWNIVIYFLYTAGFWGVDFDFLAFLEYLVAR